MNNELSIGDKVKVLDNRLGQSEVEIGDVGIIYDYGIFPNSYKVRFEGEELAHFTFLGYQLILDDNKSGFIVKDIIGKLGTEYIKIVNENETKVYYGGKIDELPHSNLHERIRNMWVYGIVKKISPAIMFVEGMRVMGLKMTIDVKCVEDFDD